MYKPALAVLLVAALAPLARPQVPSAFIENKGQWDARAKYLHQSGNVNCWITDSGIVYDLFKTVVLNDTTIRRGRVIRMSFLHTSQPRTAASNPETERTNYFIGNDPSKWVSGAGSFDTVTIQHVYDGVDALFTLDHGATRYDLVVQPGFDPSKIEMGIEGADSIASLDRNEVMIQTSMGTIEERELLAYQEVNGIRQRVDCKFHISHGNHISFLAGAFDRTKPLVIDPLLFSTFLGGGSPTAIAADRFGNSYVTGWTASQNFPVTAGAYQTSNNAVAGTNAFVSKLNSDGTALLYSTYLGGSASFNWPDISNAIAVDSAGDAFITGLAGSADFPVTPDAFQRVSRATDPNYENAFVAKLNPDGSKLLYSTYLGGSNGTFDGEGEYGAGIAVDAAGEAFIVGTTSSSDFPITPGAFQTTNGAFTYNIECEGHAAFVTKLNANGSELIYSTFLGGSQLTQNVPYPSVFNEGMAIAIDRSGNAYITGSTNAGDFPVTAGALQSANLAPVGESTGFVTKLNLKGTQELYSTFVGGTSGNDVGMSVAVDASGEAFVTGVAHSNDFPITQGALQSALRGTSNAFVAKLTADGSAPLFSTYLGGTSNDLGCAIALDSLGDSYIAGITSSNDFPVLPGAIKTTNNGHQDVFATELNPSGSAILYSTYFGGSGDDGGFAYNYYPYWYGQTGGVGAALDSERNIYLAGVTQSSDFPVTPGAFQADSGFGFVAKIAPLTMFLAADTTLHDFGSGSLCRSGDTSIIFTNAGTDSLFIKQITLSGNNFSLLRQPPSGILVPGESDTAVIGFIPASPGLDSASLLIQSNAANDSMMIVPLAARTVPAPLLHLRAVLSRSSVQAGDATTLWIYPDTAIANIALNSIQCTLAYNSDLLTMMQYTTAIPGTVVAQGSGITAALKIDLSGTNISLDPNQPLATILFQAALTDSASTEMSINNPMLNGTDPSFGKCVLSAQGSIAEFTLLLTCSDSIVMDALRQKLSIFSIRIFPNPASANVQCRLPDQAGEADIQVLDLMGRVVMTKHVTGTFALDTHTLPAGAYTILAKSGGAMARGQFVIAP